ncbi:MAG: hypothetical protein AAFV59_10840 [Pseudomonadota bacterium]
MLSHPISAALKDRSPVQYGIPDPSVTQGLGRLAVNAESAANMVNVNAPQ